MLIDTGASKNYLKPLNHLKNVGPVETKFVVQSIHGSNNVTQKFTLPIFGQTATFFILNNLSTFDGIIGLDLLKHVDAAISLKESKLLIEGSSETIHYHSCLNVNHTKVIDIEVASVVKPAFLHMV